VAQVEVFNPFKMTVHEVAQAGFGEGTNAAYDIYRPTYPEEQLDYIQANLAKPEGPLNVLELGAGTGIFTRCLLKHKTLGPAIAELHAVEPSKGMRDRFTETVKDPRVTCREGLFDTTGEADSWADLIVVAQAWHWCPDYDKALAEFARVLKPGGTAAFIWNLEDLETPWVAEIRNLYEPYDIGTPQFRLGLWRKMYEVPSFKLFKEHKEQEVTWVLPTNVPRVVERTFTKSYIAVLPDEEKAKLRVKVTEAAEKGDGRVWIDEKEGTFEYPHKNLVAIIRK